MIGDTQVITVRGYDLGLLDSYYIYYQAMCFMMKVIPDTCLAHLIRYLNSYFSGENVHVMMNKFYHI